MRELFRKKISSFLKISLLRMKFYIKIKIFLSWILILMIMLKLYFLAHHRPLRAHVEHYEGLACADDRTLCKVLRLTVLLTLQERSCRSDQEELAHPSSRHHIRNKHYHFYPKLLLISHDCLHQLLRIYLHASSFRNLYAWKKLNFNKWIH